VQVLRILARVLPRRMGLAIFGALGSAARRILANDRRRAVDNLARAFPDANRMVCDAMTRAMFRSLGRNVWEFLRLEGASPEEVARRVERVEGLEHVDSALAGGKGMLVITGHIGCWELLPAYFASIGYPVTGVARQMRIGRLNDQLRAIRASVGVHTIDRDASPRQMIDVLRRNEALGVLIDQHTRVAGVYVPFFGRPAYTPTAVARMEFITGAPIVPMASFMADSGRHVIRVLPAIEVERSDDRTSDIDRLTAKCSRAIEELIRIDPKQWVWIHDRWRCPQPGDRVFVPPN